MSTIFSRSRRKQYLVKGHKLQQVDGRELQSALSARTEDHGGNSQGARGRSVPDAARWTGRDTWLAGGR